MKQILMAVSAVALMAMALPAAATCKWGCGPKPTSGSGAASFGGNVFSENLAGAVGDHTMAATTNWKEEEGGAGVETGTGHPTTAYGYSHVATGGMGLSAALSSGPGGSIAMSGVGGSLGGDAFAGFKTK